MKKEMLLILLIDEFQRKLGRNLTKEESYLLDWVSKEHEKKILPL